MALTQNEMNEANAILNDNLRSKIDRVNDYYNYIYSKGDEYGRLGGDV